MLRGYVYLSETIYSCVVFSSDFKQRNTALYLIETRRDCIALQKAYSFG